MRKTMIAALSIVLLTTAAHAGPRRHILDANGMSVIPHPTGCPSHLFCGCGLARYWHIWKPSLNKVTNWLREFPRASGPGIGRAAVRIGGYHDHVLGIIGGRPGAWEVVDFNSGRGLSHRYTTDVFPGFRFVQVM